MGEGELIVFAGGGDCTLLAGGVGDCTLKGGDWGSCSLEEVSVLDCRLTWVGGRGRCARPSGGRRWELELFPEEARAFRFAGVLIFWGMLMGGFAAGSLRLARFGALAVVVLCCKEASIDGVRVP